MFTNLDVFSASHKGLKSAPSLACALVIRGADKDIHVTVTPLNLLTFDTYFTTIEAQAIIKWQVC